MFLNLDTSSILWNKAYKTLTRSLKQKFDHQFLSKYIINEYKIIIKYLWIQIQIYNMHTMKKYFFSEFVVKDLKV